MRCIKKVFTDKKKCLDLMPLKRGRGRMNNQIISKGPRMKTWVGYGHWGEVFSRCTKLSSSLDFASSDNTLFALDRVDGVLTPLFWDVLLSNRLRSNALIWGSLSISLLVVILLSASLQPGWSLMSFFSSDRFLSTASILCWNWWNRISARCNVSSRSMVSARSLIYYMQNSVVNTMVQGVAMVVHVNSIPSRSHQNALNDPWSRCDAGRE